jgi:hypothetical protein
VISPLRFGSRAQITGSTRQTIIAEPILAVVAGKAKARGKIAGVVGGDDAPAELDTGVGRGVFDRAKLDGQQFTVMDAVAWHAWGPSCWAAAGPP